MPKFENTRTWEHALICYALVLPWSVAIMNLGIVFFALLWVLTFFFYKKHISFNWKEILIFVSFYLVDLISLFYSDYIDEGQRNMLKKLGIVVLPIILLSLNILKQELLVNLLKAFAISIATLTICSIFKQVVTFFFLNPNNNTFSYLCTEKKLAESVIQSYSHLILSLFILIAFNFMLFMRLKRQKAVVNKTLDFFIIAIFILGILLLSSRISYILLFVLSGYYLFTSRQLVLKQKLLFTLLALILFFSSLIVNDQFNKRAMEIVNYNDEFANMNINLGGYEMRKEIWGCSWGIIKENLIFGVGIGDVQNTLDECYDEKAKNPELYIGFNSPQFHSHNIFLQIMLSSGILGITSLLLLFIFTSIRAFKNKNILFLSLMVILVLFGLTEAIFERNMNIIVFALFFPLAYKINLTQKKYNQEDNNL